MYENDRKIIFLSGPITDNEDFYLLQFKEAGEHLKRLGFIVFNPAILPTRMSKESLMNICLAAIKECDVVYFLPGWHESKGCAAEFEAAQNLGKPIFHADKIDADRRQ